jgi:dephospho-CoA kinase
VRRPVSVAITGGIGAGKSEALKAFARHGAAVASSDEIVHRLYRDDPEVARALRERYGADVFAPDGAVDRRALGRVVFADPDELAWLEALLHPRVVAEYVRWREELDRSPEPPALVVIEIPLLYETGGERRFDRVVVITAPPEVRAARARVVDDGRSRRLMSDDEKVQRADFVYVNDGSLEGLDAFVGEVVERLSRC